MLYGCVYNTHICINQQKIELVVYVIVGIIISVMATTIPSFIKSGKVTKANAIVDRGNVNIKGYISSKGRCPCPDTDGDGLENRNVAANPVDDTCDKYIGDLPWRTLGIPSGTDNWNNKLLYAVFEDLIRIDPNNFCSGANAVVAALNPSDPDLTKLHVTIDTDSGPDISMNMAYVIVSGGPMDTDGDKSIFDGRNSSGLDVEFETAEKTDYVSGYDDIVFAAPIQEFVGSNCISGFSGSLSGGGAGGCDGSESPYCGNCGDGEDNDDDGLKDCDDSDCATDSKCSSTTCDIVLSAESATQTIYIGGTVSMDLSHSSACTGTTEWSIVDKGGIDSLGIHTYTGAFASADKINKCPGDYIAEIALSDSDPDEDPDDTAEITIRVESNLVILRTSGDETADITWDDPSQNEVFQISGEYIGDINWTLDTGDATGFTYNLTGDTCTIKKNGTTTPATYTFKLKAVDDGCASGLNEAEVTLVVEVTEAGAGAGYSADLVAEWRMDECFWDGTTDEVIDTGSNGYHGTRSGNTTTKGSGRVCRAGYFDGNGDYITVSSTGSDELTRTTAFSIALWVKVYAITGTWTRIIGKGNGNNRNYGMWLRSNGTILFQIYSPSGGSNLYSTATVHDGNWHHVVIVYDFETMKVYVDNGPPTSRNYTNMPYADADPVTIGARVGGGESPERAS